MYVIKRSLWWIPGLVLFAATVVTDVQGNDEFLSIYQCDQYWSGPAIVLPAGLLPLPNGYALTDRTSHPHTFGNFAAAILNGEELGTILVGFTPNQEDWFADKTEFRVRQFTWNGVFREHLHHLSTGREMEVFRFSDGVMMQFSGAALPYADTIASCYLELLSASVETKRSNSDR